MMIPLVRIAYWGHRLWSWIVRPISLGVRIILVQEGKVLLVRHTYSQGWHFPGGLVNRFETPLEAAAREALEEAGIELLEPPRFLGIYSYYGAGRSDHVATYVCYRFRQGRATDQWEIAERRYFAVDEMPLDMNWQSHKMVRDLIQAQAQE